MAKEKFAGHDEQIDSFAQKAKDHQFGGADEAPAEPQPE
jgi:cytochrome c551/c552